MMLRSLIALALLTFPVYGGYARRATVTFPGAAGSTQANITLAFSFSDATFATVANGGVIQNATCTHVVANLPCDFVVTDDSTCATLTGSYKWGFDGDYSAVAGTGHVWVLIPSYTTSPKAVNVCYGNAAVNTYQGGAQGAEFDSNTTGVYHLADGVILNGRDSSAHAYDLSFIGAPSATNGQIDGAIALNGSSQYGQAATLPYNGSEDLTISFWQSVSFPYAANAAFSFSGYADPTRIQAHIPYSDGNAYWDFGNNTSGRISTAYTFSSAWTYVSLVGKGDSSFQAIYFNGALATSQNAGAAPAVAANGFALGLFDQGGGVIFYEHGNMDELRVSKTARSADWIATEYANQLSPPAAGSFTPLGSSGFPVVY